MAENEVKIKISAVDQASRTINEVKSNLGSFGDTTNQASQQVKTMGQRAGELSRFMLPIVGTAAAVGFGMVKVANNVEGFNKLIARAGANVEATKEELQAFRDVAVKATRDTMFSAEDAAEALFFLAGGTITAKEAQEALSDVVKFSTAAGFEDLRQGVLAVSDAMVLFKLRDEEVAKATDILTKAGQIGFQTMEELINSFQQAAPAAALAGMSMEETTAILTALGDQGFRGSEGGTALKRALEQLADSKVQDELRDIGVKVKDASGEFVGFINLLEQLEKQTQGMTGLEKQSVLSEVFGQLAGPRIASLLGLGTEGIKEYEESLKNAQGATEKASEAVNDALNPVEQLSGRWFEFQLKIAPAVIVALEGIIDWVDATTDLLVNIGPAVADGFLALIDLIKDIGNALNTMVDETTEFIVNWIADIKVSFESFKTDVKRILEDIKQAWESTWIFINEFVANLIGLMMGTVMALLDNFIASWQEKLLKLADSIVNAWQSIKSKTIENWNEIINAISDKMLEISDKIQEKLTEIKDKWNEVWGGVRDFFIGVWDAIGNKIKSVVDWIEEQIERLKMILAPIGGIVGSITGGAGGAAGSAAGAIGGAAGSIGGAIGNIGSIIGESFQDIINRGRGRASGGPVSSGQAFVVGEKGPELFVPNSNGQILAGASGVTINITGVFPNRSLAEEMGDMIIDKLKMNLRI